MKLRISENFRAVFYAPFYAIRALGLAEREGLAIEWLPSDAPGSTIEEVKRGAIDAQWGGPMRVLKDHDATPADGARLVCFGEVVGRDPFYVIGRQSGRAFRLSDLATMRLGVVSEVPRPWYGLRADLEGAGVDTAAMRSAGLLVDGLTMPQQLEALAVGKLDAVQLFEPDASRALAAGYAIVYAATSRGPTAYTAFISSRDSVSKRRDEFAALTRATQSVLNWVAENGPAELARVTESFFPDVPQDVLRSAFERFYRDGLCGSIGTATAARAAPDGYTLVFGTTSTMVVNPLVMREVPYDFWKDFALIGLIANAPHILAVREGLPAKSATELVAMAKRDPGKYTIASSGVGTIVQMAAELFKHETGADLLVVPFKGGQPATLALLSGEVDMIVNDLTTLKSNLASGKLRALAVAHMSRLKLLPDVPTFAELGMPGMISSTWWGIGTPVKTAEAVQSRLRAATAQILADPDYTARLATMAVEPMLMTPEQANAFVAAEVRKWKTVAAAAKIQLD